MLHGASSIDTLHGMTTGSPTGDATSWEEHLGSRIRSLRSEKDWSQEALAGHIQRLWGLPWTRATVTAIESGRRELSSKELFAVLDVFLTSPDQLIAGEARNSEAQLRSTYLRVSEGGAVSLRVAVRAVDAARQSQTADGRDTPAMREVATQVRSMPEIGTALRAEGTEATPELISWVISGERGETEKRVGSNLGVDARRVSVVAVSLWGHSLTAERDRRLREMAAGLEGRSAQTLKGHITREITEELRDQIGKGQ